jgi:hypothetical protein
MERAAADRMAATSPPELNRRLKKDVLEKEDQADSGPDKDNSMTRPGGNVPGKVPRATPDPEDAHIGATEDQVSDTQAPSGEDYQDEPRQG